MKNGRFIATAIAALSLGLAPAMAQDVDMQQDQPIQNEQMQGTTPGATQGTTGAATTNLSEVSDGEWVEVSGTVSEVNDDSFTLEHAEGSIDVSMADDNAQALPPLNEGELVRVSGLVEDGWLTSPSIRAQSVEIESGGAAGAGDTTGSITNEDGYGDGGLMDDQDTIR
ncbi:MAG: NirD/YgiW/YdeI family stress tolerance protein [Parvibaculum sp.]|nr:NirD/YgiW/YdeI family stress tolerance protein [Parvibaculum sp.]